MSDTGRINFFTTKQRSVDVTLLYFPVEHLYVDKTKREKLL